MVVFAIRSVWSAENISYLLCTFHPFRHLVREIYFDCYAYLDANIVWRCCSICPGGWRWYDFRHLEADRKRQSNGYLLLGPIVRTIVRPCYRRRSFAKVALASIDVVHCHIWRYSKFPCQKLKAWHHFQVRIRSLTRFCRDNLLSHTIVTPGDITKDERRPWSR